LSLNSDRMHDSPFLKRGLKRRWWQKTFKLFSGLHQDCRDKFHKLCILKWCLQGSYPSSKLWQKGKKTENGSQLFQDCYGYSYDKLHASAFSMGQSSPHPLVAWGGRVYIMMPWSRAYLAGNGTNAHPAATALAFQKWRIVTFHFEKFRCVVCTHYLETHTWNFSFNEWLLKVFEVKNHHRWYSLTSTIGTCKYGCCDLFPGVRDWTFLDVSTLSCKSDQACAQDHVCPTHLSKVFCKRFTVGTVSTNTGVCIILMEGHQEMTLESFKPHIAHMFLDCHSLL